MVLRLEIRYRIIHGFKEGRKNGFSNQEKKYYNLCDPYEPLEPDDVRNVDVDVRGEQTGHMVRGIDWVDNLVMEYEFSDKPVFKLFTGHPGSGKTTELKRFAKRLSDPNRANLFPVYIDAMEILDLCVVSYCIQPTVRNTPYWGL